MDLFEIFLIVAAFLIGAGVQRFYHILDESGVGTADPIKSWSKSMSNQSRAAKATSPREKILLGDKFSTAIKKTSTTKVSPPKDAKSELTPMIFSSIRSTDSELLNKSQVTTTALNQSLTPPTMQQTQQVSTFETSQLSLLASAPAVSTISPAAKAVPPVKRVFSTTLCDCGLELMNERERYTDDSQMPDFDQPIIFANKTLIYPISYERYRPVTLVHPPGSSELSLFVTKRPYCNETVTILMPFKPLLHSLYYAHRHATIIEDLITNYQYLED